jgi:hypothetical protein
LNQYIRPIQTIQWNDKNKSNSQKLHRDKARDGRISTLNLIRKIGKVKERDTFDDDDFFDQTKSAKNLRNTQQQPSRPGLAKGWAEDAPGKAENFASLRADYESMLLEKAKVSKELWKMAMGEDELGDAEEDELDLYMKKNDEVLKSEKKVSLINRMKELQEKLEETSGLMNYIKPNVRLESEDDIMKRFFFLLGGLKNSLG